MITGKYQNTWRLKNALLNNIRDKEEISERDGRNGRVGRFWTHLLPRTHQSYNYLYRNSYRETIFETSLRTSKKDFLQLKIKRRNHTELGRRDTDAIWPGPTLLEQQPRGRKDITASEVSPEE